MSEQSAILTSRADQPYFDALLRGEVHIQSCTSCRTRHWPAVFRCADCGSWDHVWTPVNATGEIFSWTRTWHEFGGAEAFPPPFVSVVVGLTDAPEVRLLGTLDSQNSEPEIGALVTGKIISVSFGDKTVPALQWTLNEGAV